MNYNLLFYSDKCEHSINFIKRLQEEQLLPEFKLINILQLAEIPPMIEKIPTIIVKNINVPLVGINAYKWLENRKYFYQGTNNINNKTYQTAITTDEMSNDKTAYKRSDEFANIRDADDDKTTKMKFNGASQNNRITNMTSGQRIHDTRVASDLQTKRLSDLIAVRKMQMSGLTANNKVSAFR